MEWLKMAQVAEKLKISKAAVYKRVESLREKLTAHLRQETGKTFISPEGFFLLQQSIRPKKGTLWEPLLDQAKVDSTFNQHSTESLKFKETFNQEVETIGVNGRVPHESLVKEGEDINPHKLSEKLYEKLTERFTSEVSFLKKELEKRDETVNRLLTTQGEERQRTDTIIMKLTNDVGNLQKLIEHKTQDKEQKTFEILQKEAPVIQTWKPEAPADPLEGLGFFERIWVQFVEPQKLRQYDS